MRDWQHGLKGSTDAKEWQYLPPLDDPDPKVLGCHTDAAIYAERRAVRSGVRQRISLIRLGIWLVRSVE